MCWKAWNAIVQATNALILSFGFSEEYTKSHKLRRQALDKIAKSKPEIEEYEFRDRYSARERYLHELCFYENECPLERIESELKKVEKYLKDVENLILSKWVRFSWATYTYSLLAQEYLQI